MQKDLNISLENIEKSYYPLTDEELNKVAGGFLDDDDGDEELNKVAGGFLDDDDGDDDKTFNFARGKEVTEKGSAW